MMLQVWTRLLAMQPDEFRFRVVSEVRKFEGRVRSAAFNPGWRRGGLARALSAEVNGANGWPSIRGFLERQDFPGAHRALARHFAWRASAFPVNAREVAAVAAAVVRDFPAAREDAVARGERMLAGSYDLLGYQGLRLGSTPDWHADAVHERRSPMVYWADVPYLDAAAGDHKIIWELNRHQHWLTWGRACALTGDRRFYRAFIGQLRSWLDANPPLIGTNWASMLELAFRSLAWLWALELFVPAAAEDPAEEPWLVDLLLALDRQLTHIEQNLSHYFSPNTHLSGEALALYVGGLALPELDASSRRIALGREVLLQEATRQVRGDGGHAELSAHYHRYSTDFYLLAARVAARAGDSAAPAFEEAARQQARFLRAITDDEGIRPPLGDDDGGQLFPMCGRPVEDCRPTLGIAAVLLNEPGLRIGPLSEEARWFCGADTHPVPRETSHVSSVGLPASGYYVSRTARSDHLVFDAGPHGFLNGGHAHADALSVTLKVAGRPLLIDPGTATYTMDAELRDRFRSSQMHNTVVVDGRSQSEPKGAFQWTTRATADAPIWHAARDCDYAEGTHAAYAPHRHTRSVVAVHGLGWVFLDHLVGPAARRRVDVHWHIHPAWRVESIDDHVCRLSQESETLALTSTAPVRPMAAGTTPLAMYSPVYGVVQPAPLITSSVELAIPATIATFVPAVPALAPGLRVETVPLDAGPGEGWHARAFRLRWKGGAVLVLAALEESGLATRADTAPPHLWGTSDVQTDARVALVIDYAPSRTEALLVNGSTLRSTAGTPLIALPQRTPLLRINEMASAVHEVEV